MLPTFSLSFPGGAAFSLSWDVVLVVAAYIVFRVTLRLAVAQDEIRSFWGRRVLMALAVGLLFSKLAPVFTRFQSVFEDPLLLLSMNGGISATIGGVGMGFGILLVSWLQLKRLKPESSFKRVWGTLGLGLLLFVAAHGTLAWVWNPGPLPLTLVQKSAFQALLPQLEGNPRSLSDFKKKALIVNFWATWCPPCRAELPELQEAYGRKLSNVEIVGINLTSSEKNGIETVKDFVQRHKVNWPMLLDESNTLSAAFDVTSVPTTIVFDSQGRIVERRVGVVDLSWILGLDRSYGK